MNLCRRLYFLLFILILKKATFQSQCKSLIPWSYLLKEEETVLIVLRNLHRVYSRGWRLGIKSHALNPVYLYLFIHHVLFTECRHAFILVFRQVHTLSWHEEICFHCEVEETLEGVVAEIELDDFKRRALLYFFDAVDDEIFLCPVCVEPCGVNEVFKIVLFCYGNAYSKRPGYSLGLKHVF